MKDLNGVSYKEWDYECGGNFTISGITVCSANDGDIKKGHLICYSYNQQRHMSVDNYMIFEIWHTIKYSLLSKIVCCIIQLTNNDDSRLKE